MKVQGLAFRITLLVAVILVALALPLMAVALPPIAVDPDPNGVLLKPIPDKLVVLTFDDGPASHATIVTPILKSLGFGGSFYIADFDSFHTRKDWYMTYRQMKAMAKDGFEIGNHTVGHGGGLENYLRMEDQLLANGVPKTTTVCWPVYNAVKNIYDDLSARGYTFGRGGHERPYRPTVDSPFDVPSFTMRDGISVETFAKRAQLACQGRVVVFCFHGVPDMEHPSVGLEPETFKAMMQYLKDNGYQCIALRDMAKYIDTAKAAKLPPTISDTKGAAPFKSLVDEKPYVAVAARAIENFSFPGLPSARISQSNISVTVPFATDITSLTPKITVSAGASVMPATGVARNFTQPQTYSVKSIDGSIKTYTVTVSKSSISKDAEILSLKLPGIASASITPKRIGISVAKGTDVTTLAPEFTISPFATAVPPSGTKRDFTKPQTYSVTAQDGSKQVTTVTVVHVDKPGSFTWNKVADGNWSDATMWSNNLGTSSSPTANGQEDYILNFNLEGKYAGYNDLGKTFQLNQFNILQTRGLKLSGNPINFTTNKITGNSPQINSLSNSESDHISLPINFDDDFEVNVKLRARLTLEGLISGKGRLILNCPDASDIEYSRWGILRIDNKINTYSGGTLINGGQLFLFVANQGLGTGPVTLNQGGDIRLEGIKQITNPLIINGGTVEGTGNWNAPIKLNGIARFAGHLNLNELGGGMSGPGGFTQIGPIGAFSRINVGEVVLWGTNTYTGPTTVHMGTLILKKAASLYNADPASWTASKISVHPTATLQISAGGPGEFTGEHISALLPNLTASVNENGLQSRSVFCVDTSKATSPIIVNANISDSNGTGGGAFIIKKIGAGILQLSGNNSFTGQMIIEGGALSFASLNSVANGNKTSSLGAPTSVEHGEIFIGKADGECTLIYTGQGETSDRVMNLAGKNSTVVFDHAGTGLLKLTSAFVISGYGHSKTIMLKGDTAGVGELAGAIIDPIDRTGKATTSIIKSGSGKWVLSAENTYMGPTIVKQGVLAITNARGLGMSAVTISKEAVLELNFTGEVKVRSLTLDGKIQTAGLYDAAKVPGFLKGTGIINVQP